LRVLLELQRGAAEKNLGEPISMTRHRIGTEPPWSFRIGG
jgi:hypothetical protein